jgi:tryptophan synthase alpha chain
MSAISAKFGELRRKSEGALIAYVMVGDPTPRHTPKIVDALVDGGADIIELGIPFSDPIADGPTLQRAAVRALHAGTRPKEVFNLASDIAKARDVPIVIMTYFNIIYRAGIEAFFSASEKSGVDGIIAPDLPVEEATAYLEMAKRHGLDTIFLAAPSTSKARLERLLNASSGFLYLVSTNAVTGARETLRHESVTLIHRTASRVRGRIPLAVGFGLALPSHVKQVIENGADAAIVGSKFAQIVEQNLNHSDRMLKELRHCAQTLKKGTVVAEPHSRTSSEII